MSRSWFLQTLLLLFKTQFYKLIKNFTAYFNHFRENALSVLLIFKRPFIATLLPVWHAYKNKQHTRKTVSARLVDDLMGPAKRSDESGIVPKHSGSTVFITY